MDIRIIKIPITRKELQAVADGSFGELVKAVVDIKQGTMAIGGEFHAEEEMALMENENSQRDHTWGINVYPKKQGDDFIEFDSMINLKPAFGNRTRYVENPEIRKRVQDIVSQLIKD